MSEADDTCCCDKLPFGALCYYCRNPRTKEEREELVRRGIESTMSGKANATLTREQQFAAERERLAKKRYKKPRSK